MAVNGPLSRAPCLPWLEAPSLTGTGTHCRMLSESGNWGLQWCPKWVGGAARPSAIRTVFQDVTVDCLLAADFHELGAIIDHQHATQSLGRETRTQVPLTLGQSGYKSAATAAVATPPLPSLSSSSPIAIVERATLEAAGRSVRLSHVRYVRVAPIWLLPQLNLYLHISTLFSVKLRWNKTYLVSICTYSYALS